jgi:hypothetical protein
MIQKLYACVYIMLIMMLTAFGMEKEITYPCDFCQKEQTELNYTVVTSKTKTCDHILCQKCHFMIEDSYTKPIDFDPCTLCSYMLRVKKKECWKELKKPIEIDMQYHSCIKAAYFKKHQPNRALADASKEIKNPEPENQSPSDIINNTTITYPCDNCCVEKLILNRYILCDNDFECLHILCEDCADVIDKVEDPNDDLCNYCSYFYHHKRKECWAAITEEKDVPLTIDLGLPAEYFFFNYQNRVLRDATATDESDDDEELISLKSSSLIPYKDNYLSEETTDLENAYQEVLYNDITCIKNNNEHTHVPWNPEINKFWSEHSYFPSFHKNQNQRYWQSHQKYPINNNPNTHNMYSNPTENLLLLTYHSPITQNARIMPSHQQTDHAVNTSHQRQAPHNPANPPSTTAIVTHTNSLKWFGAAGFVIICCYGVYKIYTWLKYDTPQEEASPIDNYHENNELLEAR